MTKRDFFRILIKLFGLYSVFTSIFYFIPLFYQYGYYDGKLSSVLILLVSITITFLIIYILIFKSDSIINFFKLDKNFDDESIKIGNFNSFSISLLAILLLGGYFIIVYLSNFVFYTLLAFRAEVKPTFYEDHDILNFATKTDYIDWIISGVNIIIGYLLISNYRRLAKWLTKNDK